MVRLPITAVAKPRMTRRDKWLNPPRPIVLAYRTYCDNLRILTRYSGYHLGEQLRITFVFPMPQSWSKKKQKEMEGLPHKQTPDLDNLIKGFTDALTDDDAAIWNIAAVKLWGKEGVILVENYEIK